GLNINEIDVSLEPLLMGTMNFNINYYPPCPNPSITIGDHQQCDVSWIILLFQDDTRGLYVRGTKGVNWIHVNTIKGALMVKLGDFLQIMSNDQYKSIEHCLAVDSSRARISIPLFMNASLDSVIGPFSQMLKDGDKPMYKHNLHSNYWDYFYRKRPCEPLLMNTMNININYYPPCPNPSITIGARRHCDVSCITLFFQDDMGGLYVRGTKGDNWIHIMINDRYKSIEHCVAVDSSRPRISVLLFMNSSLDSVIGPFSQMLKDGEKPVYKHILHSNCWDYFYHKKPCGNASIDFAKI
ncbi:hypothetical protein H5410_015062, partial [Solanum commersonii]